MEQPPKHNISMDQTNHHSFAVPNNLNSIYMNTTSNMSGMHQTPESNSNFGPTQGASNDYMLSMQ